MGHKNEIPTINTKVLIDNMNPQRAEDESFEDYKYRQLINKNIFKAKRVQWSRLFRTPSFWRHLDLKYIDSGYIKPNF